MSDTPTPDPVPVDPDAPMGDTDPDDAVDAEADELER